MSQRATLNYIKNIYPLCRCPNVFVKVRSCGKIEGDFPFSVNTEMCGEEYCGFVSRKVKMCIENKEKCHSIMRGELKINRGETIEMDKMSPEILTFPRESFVI